MSYTKERKPDYGGPTSFETVEKHPSFGMVGISRVTSTGTRMFGSHQDKHSTLFEFTVSTAKRESSTHGSRAYVDKTLIRFSLTAAQFVELMTSLNVGDGVPCTLTWKQGEGNIEPVPEEHKTEEAMIAEEFKNIVGDIAASTKPMIDKISEILAKKSIKKADREEIAKQVRFITRIYGDSAPFVMDQFSRSADKKLAAGKAELDATLSTVLMAAGLHHLRALNPDDDVPVVERKPLPEGDA
jgi:hypothetical protein